MEYKHNKNLVRNAKELRKNMTKEEQLLWYRYLRNYPIKFLRQKIIGNYILDFYCAKAKLAVELDGSQHYDDVVKEYDEQRTAFLDRYDISVVRIWNGDVLKNFQGVCDYIDMLVQNALK